MTEKTQGTWASEALNKNQGSRALEKPESTSKQGHEALKIAYAKEQLEKTFGPENVTESIVDGARGLVIHGNRSAEKLMRKNLDLVKTAMTGDSATIKPMRNDSGTLTGYFIPES